MFGFGWITQEQIRGTMIVNNVLTREIKDFLLANHYEHFRGEGIGNKNCLYHKKRDQYVIVYTRNKSEQKRESVFAPYEYVKNIAESKERVILLLGILEDDSLQGELYRLDNADIRNELAGRSLVRGKHYSLGENQIQEKKIGFFCNREELRKYLSEALESEEV